MKTRTLVMLVVLAGSCGYPQPERLDGSDQGGGGASGSGRGGAGGGAAGRGGSGGSIGGSGGSGGASTPGTGGNTAGASGASGAAGTAGVTGTAGSAGGGTAGNGAGGTASGSAGAAAGRGGSTGGSAAGTGGSTAGRGGSTAGTGGSAAGTGGSAAGTGGSAGTGGGSVCGGTAQCVSLGGGTVGVLTSATGNCPGGFGATETVLYQTPDGGTACTGCGCTGGITCTATVYMYANASMCQIDSANTGGSMTATLDDVTAACKGLSSNSANRITAYQAATTCTKNGTATLPTITWGSRTKFCAANSSYTSCGSGSCLPTGTAQPLCILISGTATCPANYPAYQGTSLWYSSFTDGRTCSTCSCNLTAGTGGCSSVSMYYSSISCSAGDPQSLPFKSCNQVDHASIYTVGKGTPPSCTSTSTLSGTVTPTAGKTLCCSN
jgi:hypothetical protein